MSDLNSEVELIDSARQLPQPVNTRISQYHHLEEHAHNDLGIYKNIRIQGYQHGRSEGKLMRLVYFDQVKRKLEVDEHALQLFQRYAAYEIAFLSVMGERGNGKSFILDKLLNLAGVKGNHVPYWIRQLSVNHEEGLFVWSQPFRKRNLRVFLLDCRGFSSQAVTQTERNLSAMLLLLSSTVIFNNRTKIGFDDFKVFQALVQNILGGCALNGRPLQKQDGVSPRSLYHLYRSRSLATATQMSHFFPAYDFTFLEDAMVANYKGSDNDLVECSFLATNCINEKYVRHLGDIFTAVLGSIEEKTICGVTFNGNIVGKVVRGLAQMLNREATLDVGRLFKGVIAQLYVSAYNYCVIAYSDLLQKQLQDEAPKSLQNMLRILGGASDDTMQKYHQFNLDPQLHRQYLTKLQQHIEMKEKLLLEINLKKTQNLLRAQFRVEPARNIDMAVRNAEALARFHPQLDHGRDVVVAEIMGKWAESAASNLGNYELQLAYESKQEELAKITQELALSQQKRAKLEEDLRHEDSRLYKQMDQEKEAAAALDAQVKKLQSVARQRTSVSSNIDEMRNQYETSVLENDKKIAGLTSQITSLAANPIKPPPVKAARPEPSAVRKELNALSSKDKDLTGILSLQDEQIRSLNNEIAAKSKKK